MLMKKKMKIFFKSLCFKGVLPCLIVGALASCAQGFDNDELYTSKVTDSQLESPAQNELTFSSKVNADGTESIQVTWPVVSGAGGYQCRVCIVDDPANPVEIFNQVVDGTSFLFDKQEDTRYEVSIQTLGDEKLGNTDATQATIVDYTTLLQAQTIPAGTDIVEFIKANILDQDEEQAFELEGGATYEINSELDFGTRQVTFRGDKTNRPIVKFGIDGVIRTCGGLKIKFINFDCTEQASNGVVECTSNPPASLAASNFGHPGSVYILQNPIIFQECFFRNVPRCLFHTGYSAWGVEDVRVTDCIVQLDNDGSTFGDGAVLSTCGDSYFNGSQSWAGAIRNITIRNSTIYNIKKNAKNRMIRFWSNQMGRIYNSQYGSATIENCTFSQTFTDKEFANNTPNRAEYTITFNNNICYDCWRLQKFIQGNCTKNVNKSSNTIWGVTQSVDSTDKGSYATEEDPLFAGDITQPLDLAQPNGGVNFRASGSISSTIGDPRWRE